MAQLHAVVAAHASFCRTSRPAADLAPDIIRGMPVPARLKGSRSICLSIGARAFQTSAPSAFRLEREPFRRVLHLPFDWSASLSDERSICLSIGARAFQTSAPFAFRLEREPFRRPLHLPFAWRASLSGERSGRGGAAGAAYTSLK